MTMLCGGRPVESPLPHDVRLNRMVSVKQLSKKMHIALVACLVLSASALFAEGEIPEWCRGLPRVEYKSLQRLLASDSWFEVYVVAPAVFAIYEPHQSEETISYLIVGDKQALLFDTGMGIGDIRKVAAELTRLPIVVMNSHTHDDHVGSNWQFHTIYAMDTEFTRQNARGSHEDAQAEVAPGQICGTLPRRFERKTYATRSWKITAYRHDGDRIDLGGRSLDIIATPGHTPDSISLLDRDHGLLFTGDTYYPGTIWLYRPETNLEAYGSSIRRLAALVPRVKTILGAHNIPVAPPSVLTKLVTAFEAIRGGKIPATPASPGKVVYKVDEISFLMHAAESKP
jgi:glyoxylase-like metal-dependent hydrolase (beta-lactamase superfamily II)